jgi:hypothetical protein
MTAKPAVNQTDKTKTLRVIILLILPSSKIPHIVILRETSSNPSLSPLPTQYLPDNRHTFSQSWLHQSANANSSTRTRHLQGFFQNLPFPKPILPKSGKIEEISDPVAVRRRSDIHQRLVAQPIG